MHSRVFKGLFFAAAIMLGLSSVQPLRADVRVKSWRQLAAGAGRLAISSQNVITYDKVNANGLYDVWTMNLDGSNNTCLTCSAAAVQVLGALNKGNPKWDPSGKFIVFQVQYGTNLGADNVKDFPGSGYSNNLWIMDAAGQNFWPITKMTDPAGGVIYPRFSWDGKTLAWGQRISPSPAAWGTWQLMTCSFAVSSSGPGCASTPQSHVPEFQSPNQYYYEPHGFSTDNQSVFFMANIGAGGTPAYTGPGPMDIYGLNLATNQLTQLTSTPGQWNEFPTPIPGGNSLVYMSTVPDGAVPGHFKGDFYMVNTDGTNRYRLTYFTDPNSPDFQSGGIVAADPEWNADGTELLMYDNQGKGETVPGNMWILDIEPAAATFNGASFFRGAAPGVVVSMFAPPNLATQTASAPGQPLPTNLRGTTVTVTDARGTTRNAGLYYVSPGQVNVVIPPGTAPGPAVVQVTNAQGTQVRATVEMAAVAPGLFTMNQNGKGVPAGYVQVVSGGSSTNVPLYNCSSGAGACTTNPIDVSNSSNQYFLTLYGTGFRGRSSLQTVSVAVGNRTFPAVFAGAQGQYDALDQLNVQLPSSLAGAGMVNVVLTVDGVPSNTVQIQIQ